MYIQKVLLHVAAYEHVGEHVLHVVLPVRYRYIGTDYYMYPIGIYPGTKLPG